ncbi:DarT ssDNA thymidine ADP-ribosyltransferase family protein [Hymenobacter sp. BT559]|uniref:DarT ssDNA thymidine ADP-ribosyltransferase family protein n=1 Tax=Hymenobacter sp. BT559 TaxID=2795729 RepID=UPI0018ED6817|nr:DarT ssDNA thymidine ADP-ribosyltransferase family protein [Hymenobacter sp. BT559]MBJ6146315.1 DUF4433 domain-containing protein [Hymenobacter sp. BT559]
MPVFPAVASPYPGFSFLFSPNHSLTATQFEVQISCRRARPILPEEEVILRFLDFFGGEVQAEALGTALGFALTEDFTAKPLRYRDPAEVALWNDLLKDLEDFGLINRLETGIVRRTAFAAVALQQQVKYEYFTARCAYWQFSGLTVSASFPFASLGLIAILNGEHNQPHPGRQTNAAPPSSAPPIEDLNDTAAVLSILSTQLADSGSADAIEVLGLVPVTRPATYPLTRSIPVTAYCYRLTSTPTGQNAPDYRITGTLSGQVSPALTAAFNEPVNAALRLRWGHDAEFAAFWDNPAALIDAPALTRFASYWRWSLVLPDPRLAWSAPDTLLALLRLLPVPERRQLSELIPLTLLEAEVDSYPALWEWTVLSTRLSEEFITAKLASVAPEGTPLYSWDFEILSGRNPDAIENWLTQLLRSPWADQMGRSESFQWDWAVLAERLSEAFILAHLGVLPFSRAVLLRRGSAFLEAALQAEIAASQLGHWNWRYVAGALSQQFLWDQLPSLAAYLPWPQVLERLLGSGQPTPVNFALSRLLKLVQTHHDDINPLTTQNLAWTPELVAFFDNLELLHWASSSLAPGFECHPSVTWTAEHFTRYHHRVHTAQGAAHVSAQIGSLDLVAQFPDFAWDWVKLSANPRLTWTRQLTARYRSRIVWSQLLARFGASEVASRLPDLHTQLLEARPDALPDLWRYANRTLPVPTLLGWLSGYTSHLDFTELSRRDPVAVAQELLARPNFDLAWDWSALASHLPPAQLTDLLREADIYYQHIPDPRLADLSRAAAARLPLDFSLSIAPGLLLPWDWNYVSEHIAPEQLDAHLTAAAAKVNWNLIVQRPLMQPLLKSAWVLDSRVQPWLSWPMVSRLLAPAQVEAHLDTLAFHLDWDYLARQPAFASLVLTRLLDHEIVRERLPWDHVLEMMVTPSDLADNLLSWSRRLLLLTAPDVSAVARAAFTRRLPVASIISDSNTDGLAYPPLTTSELAALPLDWAVLSGDSRVAHRLTVDTLRRYQSLWHWPTLSCNPELNADAAYLLHPSLRQRWDWAYISQHSAFIRPYQECNKARKHFKRFARFIDWPALSLRHDLLFFGELLYAYDSLPWDWTVLSASPALRLSDSDLLNLQDKYWNWAALSANKGVKITLPIVEQLASQPWDWAALSANRSVSFDHPTLVLLANQPWDWDALVRRPDLSWNPQMLRDFAGYALDWTYLSGLRRLDWSTAFIHEFQDYLDWRVLSRSPPFILTADLLRGFASRWDFTALSHSQALADPPVSADPAHRPAQPASLLVPTADLPWDWPHLCARSDIRYNTQLLDRLAEYLHWPTLSRRPWGVHFELGWVQLFCAYWDFPVLAVHAGLPEAAQSEVKAFIKADETRILPYLYALERHAPHAPRWAGYAFHSTHLTNAASIIRSGQLLSRSEVLKTSHKLADASGSINHSPSEVWNYARLYYRPHTLTQFYVERLGLDSSWRDDNEKHYLAAESLGFPKCPIPVYFRFRLSEILATQPDRFHISDGNMQRSAVTHGPLRQMFGRFNPNYLLFYRLDTDGFLGDKFPEFKDVSQQEILLKPSLDITKLDTVDIIVPNDWAYNELLNLIGPDHPLAQRVQIGNSTFHGGNRAVDCGYSDTHIDVDTDFVDAHDLMLECDELAHADLSEMEPGTYRLAGNRLLTQQKLRVSWSAPVSFRVLFRDKVTSRPGGPREYELFQSLKT